MEREDDSVVDVVLPRRVGGDGGGRVSGGGGIGLAERLAAVEIGLADHGAAARGWHRDLERERRVRGGGRSGGGRVERRRERATDAGDGFGEERAGRAG